MSNEGAGKTRWRILLSAFALSGIGLVGPASAQEAVYIIRHAEKQAEGSDPPLTRAGRQRAARWAHMLGHAGLDAVVTSDATRTRETGGIIAEALALPIDEVLATDIEGLMSLLSEDHSEGRVLVVGHTETIPEMLGFFGMFDLIEIDDSDFANLFVVTPADADEPSILHLRMP